MSDERCDPEVWQHGKQIVMLDGGTGGRKAIEGWVRKIADRSGQKVDWSYCGGRAIVQYVGDYYAVLRAIDDLELEFTGRILRRWWKQEG